MQQLQCPEPPALLALTHCFSTAPPTSIPAGQASFRAESAGSAPASSAQAEARFHMARVMRFLASLGQATQGPLQKRLAWQNFVRYALKHARSQLDGNAKHSVSTRSQQRVFCSQPMGMTCAVVLFCYAIMPCCHLFVQHSSTCTFALVDRQCR